MKGKAIALPSAIIPFILRSLDGLDICLEDGERIIITPKAGALASATSWSHLQSALLQKVTAERTRPRAKAPVLRPKFSYIVRDPTYTPEQAKAFGMSKQRLKVFEIIHAAGEQGVGYKDIRAESGLPHGSVTQILDWMRKQKLITGEPLMRN